MKAPRKSPSSALDSLLNGANAAYLDAIYQEYENNPDNFDPGFKALFDEVGHANGATPTAAPYSNGAHHGRAAPTSIAIDDAAGKRTYHAPQPGESGYTKNAARRQAGVLRLIAQHRTRGHQMANLDPLGLNWVPEIPDLTLLANGLTDEDLDQQFNTGSLAVAETLTLREIMALLSRVYCGSLATEYMHITETTEKRWIQRRLETSSGEFITDTAKKRHILERLTAAEGLERYLHTKYVGQKRFSLEGSESLIPMLDELIQSAGTNGCKEIVIGMAHRGRLNVLVNTLGKAPRDLFGEFEGKYGETNDELETGDVKYHMGFSSDIVTDGGPVHIALAFNPSHLEIINPVVEGSVRARQERRDDVNRDKVLPVLIHGDAAFAGQGVVMETLNMSQCRGYGTGGTVHIIVNNQIGFTTSNPLDARSTLYCTEIAKLVQAPIFHVNGDDPEAAVFAIQTALQYRNEFNKDVIVDLCSYRRHGHNEADEPAVTQPYMYKVIKDLPTTRQIYSARLAEENSIPLSDSEHLVQEYRDRLDAGKVVAGQIIDPNKADKMVDWTPYLGTDWRDAVKGTLSVEKVKELSRQLLQIPDGYVLHRRVEKILEDRAMMTSGQLPIDWGFAETLAYATIVDAGQKVRLSGQDSGRGTFFHRHAVLHNQTNRETWVPLRDALERTGNFLVINSLLSEEAVLGFEYGYSTTEPETLVIWEAQFGDFANGAQVVVDQFISSGEAKWGRLSALTMMLPHGYEGQGPEHSSARLERYLQLCANQNIQIVVPSTPAQMFHVLRRQALREYRRPLIILSPKSLLRHKMSVSTLEELAHGKMKVIINDPSEPRVDQVNRVVLCSGKVYFDLAEERAQRDLQNVALVRIEQLYPFPRDELIDLLSQYPSAKEIVWCQEEPQNQGAWYQIRHHLRACLQDWHNLEYAGRDPSASPAVGFYKLHLVQQTDLVNAALSASHGTPTTAIQ